MIRQSLIAAAVGTALFAGSASAASYLVMAQPGANLDAAVAAAGGTITKRIAAIDVLVVEAGKASFKSKMKAVEGVSAVVPNLRINWRGGEPKPEHFVGAELGNPPNSGSDDPRFDLQWGHDAVDAIEAWEAGYRGQGARVAVLDGGFQPAHPDLAANVDLACSADMTGEGLDYGPNDDDALGLFSHGMHVAGTIAAVDNTIGGIGVAPDAKLCLVKVLFNVGSGTFEDVAEGIVYAADQDVDVINMSLGGILFKSGVKGEYTAREAVELRDLVGRAVRYAHQNGTLVISSAGNEGIDGDKDKNLIHLPSDAPHVMSVSATAPIGWATPAGSPLDYPASYTNYGRSVISVAAPGGDFVYPGNENCTVAGLVRPCFVFDFVFSTGALNAYYWSVGTSMASPHVAGVAALAISRHGRLAPNQLRTLLERSADDLGQPGNDPFYGAGRVNAAKAVE